MGKAGKKPRRKMDGKKFEGAEGQGPKPKKEKDWSFEDIARSKLHRR